MCLYITNVGSHEQKKCWSIYVCVFVLMCIWPTCYYMDDLHCHIVGFMYMWREDFPASNRTV